LSNSYGDPAGTGDLPTTMRAPLTTSDEVPIGIAPSLEFVSLDALLEAHGAAGIDAISADARPSDPFHAVAAFEALIGSPLAFHRYTTGE
jgi:hypothetical protein